MGLLSVVSELKVRNAAAQLSCVFVLGAFGAGCTAGEEPNAVSAAQANTVDSASTEATILAQKPVSPHYNPHAKSDSTAATSGRFEEGKHYKALKGVPKYEATDKIQVAEFFSYGCPHCFKMERTLKKWHDSKPASITFERIPAYWNPSFQLLAQAYYTMSVLNVEDTLHDKLFETIHVRRQQLNSKEAIRQVFVEAGVSAEDFDKTFDSFAVQQKMKMASQLFKTYGLKHVPVFVVGGQYVTDVSMAGSRDAVPEVIEYLARKLKVSEKQ